MNQLKDLIAELETAGLNPKKTILKSMNMTGKESVGCFPIYTPEEIVYAAGYLPVGMWGGSTELKLADKYLQGFCCSIMRSNMEYGMKGTYDMLKAVVLSTFCDTLKCICENWKVAVPGIPVIPVVYPQHRRIEAGNAYMVEEFIRTKGELEKLSNKEISDAEVESAFEIYEEYRATMRHFVEVVKSHLDIVNANTRHYVIKAGYFMDKKEYIPKIKKIIEELNKQPINEFSGVKVIVTGLLAEPKVMLDSFVENRIAFIADDLAQESRQFRTVARAGSSPYHKMAYRIADQRGCTFLFEEEKTRGQMLIDMVKENHADAVVVVMMKFCDPEEFDYPVYKEELEKAGIPMLYLEVDQQMDASEQLRTRIQSFAEMLM